MLDTQAVARSLTDADFTPAQADAITNAVRQAVEQDDQVTSDQFRAGLAEVRTEIASLDMRLSTQAAEMRAEQRTGIAGVRTEISEVRTEIANLDTRLSTQMADLRAEQRAEAAAVRSEIANLETRLIRWMVGTVIATATLTVGIVRLIG